MQHIGETSVVKRTLRLTSPATEKFIAGCEVIREAPLDGEPAFMARQLVQCTLPHSNPGNVPVWSRKNGNVSLTLQPGFDENDECIGFPFGTLPRLLLFWMIREILRTNSRRLNLSGRDERGKENATLSGFMRELGLIPASAGGHAARRLKDQMRRLFNCRISFRVIEEAGDHHGERWLHMEVAPEGELWWDVKRPEQGSLWNSWIEVGEKFYQAVIQSPVPVDMRALRLLKNSALCLDLYSWCVWKAFEARRTGRKQSIAWKTLMRQLGCEYSGKDSEKTFKKNAAAALTVPHPGQTASLFPSASTIQPVSDEIRFCHVNSARPGHNSGNDHFFSIHCHGFPRRRECCTKIEPEPLNRGPTGRRTSSSI